MERTEADEAGGPGFGFSSLLTSRLECDLDTGVEKMGGDGRTPARLGCENELLELPGAWRATDDVVTKDAADGVRAPETGEAGGLEAAIGRLLLARENEDTLPDCAAATRGMKLCGTGAREAGGGREIGSA